MAGLASLDQFDFSAGMVRAVAPELIPKSGVYTLLNYLLDQDGGAYRRGGSFDFSDSAFGAGGLTFIWDGFLAAGQRTIFANPSDFGALGHSATNVVNLGGAGLAQPTRAVALDGVLYVDNGPSYAGSLLTADYSTGTLALTQDSAAVVGTGTSWAANVDPGMILVTTDGRSYAVADVADNTHLTLASPYRGSTGSGASYTAKRLGTPVRAGIYGVVGKRLLIGVGSRLYFTPWGDQQTSNADDFHLMPNGAQILGIDSLGTTAVVLTTDGVFVVTNMDLEPLDDFANIQQQLDRVNPGLILWGKEALAKWRDELIVPGTDGIWLFGTSSLERIDLSIAPLYRAYVAAGYRPGGAAVYRGNYVLPIIDHNNVVIDTLLCRLDRPTRTSIGVIYPWVQLKHGTGYDVRAYAQRIDIQAASVQGYGPRLWGAAANGRVVQSQYFEPYDKYAQDGNQDFPTVLVTRAFPTGRGNQNQIRRADLFYELFDVHENVGPTIKGEWSTGERDPNADWDTFVWGPGEWDDPAALVWGAMDDEAPEYVDGINPHVFHLSGRGRHVQLRFTLLRPTEVTGISSKLRIKGVRLLTRQSRKVD